MGVVIGGVISSSVISAVAAGCRAVPTTEAYVPAALNEDRYEIVGHFVDVILPATDSPGATDAGVPSFVDQMLASWFSSDERESFLRQLDLLEAEANGRFGSGFASIDHPSREQLVSDIAVDSDVSNPTELNTLFRRMKELTLVGYYTSEVGSTQELRVMPMGEWKADVPYQEVGRAWT